MKIPNRSLLIGFLTAASLLAGCRPGKTVPEELTGKWATSVPEYRDTYFQITESTLVFGDKDGGINSYPIERVRRKKSENPDWELFQISYGMEHSVRGEFSILLFNGPPEIIRLKNLGDIAWSRQ